VAERARRLAPGLGLIACVAALLGACAQQPVPAERYFRLLAASPPRLAAPALDGTLVVKRPLAGGLLAQRPLVYASTAAPRALSRYHYRLWADAPPAMLQQLVVRALREAGVARQVVTPGHGVRADYVLSARLLRLEHLVGDAPAVAVALELSVIGEAGHELLWLHGYEERLPVATPGLEAAVAAMDEALSRILARFVADLAAR